MGCRTSRRGGMNYSGRNSRDVLGDLDLNVE